MVALQTAVPQTHTTQPSTTASAISTTATKLSPPVIGLIIASIAALFSLIALGWYLLHIRRQTKASTLPTISIVESNVSVETIHPGEKNRDKLPSSDSASSTYSGSTLALKQDPDAHLWQERLSFDYSVSVYSRDITIGNETDQDSDCESWRYRRSHESTTGRSAFDNDRTSVDTDEIDWTLIQPC